MYKATDGLSPPLISDTFKQKNSHPYNLLHNSQFSRPLVKTVFHGTKSISYLGPIIWDILPVTKIELKKWKPGNCPCRLCKTYVSTVGSI